MLFVGVHARQIIGWPTAEGRIGERRELRRTTINDTPEAMLMTA